MVSSIQRSVSLPPVKYLSPHYRSKADTSCVTGLPARAKHRSCRIFLPLRHLQYDQSRPSRRLYQPLVPDEFSLLERSTVCRPLPPGVRPPPGCLPRHSRSSPQRTNGRLLSCQAPNRRNPIRNNKIAVAYKLWSNPYN